MSCRSTKGRYLANESRCIITLITEYLTWLVKTKTHGNFKKKNKKGKKSRRWWQVPAGDGEGSLKPGMREVRGEGAREKEQKRERREMRKEQFCQKAKEILGEQGGTQTLPLLAQKTAHGAATSSATEGHDPLLFSSSSSSMGTGGSASLGKSPFAGE